MKPRLEIRALGPDERNSWEPLWQGYLTFYKSTVTPEVTKTTWGRLHDSAEPMHVLGAFLDGTLVGIVHYLFHRSTWTIGVYCYLQDLFAAVSAAQPSDRSAATCRAVRCAACVAVVAGRKPRRRSGTPASSDGRGRCRDEDPDSEPGEVVQDQSGGRHRCGGRYLAPPGGDLARHVGVIFDEWSAQNWRTS
jgi:hypothetical protein